MAPRAITSVDVDHMLDRLRTHLGAGGVMAKAWGANVRERRKQMGLNQQQLAELISPTFPIQTISKIERGEIVPRDYLRAALALRMGTDTDELFPTPKRTELLRAVS